MLLGPRAPDEATPVKDGKSSSSEAATTRQKSKQTKSDFYTRISYDDLEAGDQEAQDALV
jgi:hypothetical protein